MKKKEPKKNNEYVYMYSANYPEHGITKKQVTDKSYLVYDSGRKYLHEIVSGSEYMSVYQSVREDNIYLHEYYPNQEMKMSFDYNVIYASWLESCDRVSKSLQHRMDALKEKVRHTKPGEWV